MRTIQKHTIISQSKQLQVLRQNLEIERVVNLFARKLMEKRTVEDVVVDIIENCITHLHFLDCVVYQLNEKQKVLIQPVDKRRKTPEESHSFYPEQIPLGIGIVGSAAFSGKAEVVKDITKDNRFTGQTQERYSQIIVPMSWKGKVVGVIYASHPKINFFRPKHLKILTHIALMCAIKIKSTEIEQTNRRIEKQFLKRQKRLAEIKLLSLQMQLNPHFMFNSLTSINYFILQQNTELASRLLTKFSRLMRQILENAQSDWVSLKNELNALRLYVELEQIRSGNKFIWRLQVSEYINLDTIRIPPFILQPFVQHAIWQRLLPVQKENLSLQITCYQEDNTFVLVISDNGNAGKTSSLNDSEAQTEIKTQRMTIMQEHMQLINKLYGTSGQVEIREGNDDIENPAGNTITFTMKIPFI
jgi:LytS/YehU family sensor histidine kinase